MKNKMITIIPVFVLGLLLLLAPLILPVYLQSLIIKIIIFAIFAMSLDLLIGYTGLFSLGHAIFFGLGAYTIAILTTNYGIESFWIIAPLGILVALFSAALFGLVALRLEGVYFLLITLALGQMFESLARKMYQFAGGDHGLSGISRPVLNLTWFIWNSTVFYYFALTVFIICFILLYVFVNSPFGLTLKGIHSNPQRMRALGYNIWLHKYIVFIISGAFASIAGILFVYFNGVVAPTNFSSATSTMAMLMVIIGGAGTLVGPVIGAAVIILVEFYASIYVPGRWPLLLGFVFVFSVMYMRTGIGAYLFAFWEKVLLRYGSFKG